MSWHERWWTLARPDFRAAAARRLSEERELSPAIVSLLSPDGPTRSVGVRIVPVDKIEPNPEQPRLVFNQETLDELAASIREHGVLQPILVRPLGPNTYQIVAGERCRIAGQVREQSQHLVEPARSLSASVHAARCSRVSRLDDRQGA